MKVLQVILPIGSDPNPARRREAIATGALASNYAATFPEYGLDKPFSVTRARSEILASQAVLADLTLSRPSCYYEVGLAQALHSHVILIAEEGTVVHQVGDRDRVVFYDSIESLSACLREVLGALQGNGE